MAKETKHTGYNFSQADINLIKTLLSLPEDHLEYAKIFETIYGQSMHGNMGIIRQQMSSIKRIIADKEFYDLLDSELAKESDPMHTSRLSYEETQATNMSDLQQQIYNLISSSEESLSRNDIANHTGLRINCVTARVHELIKMGKVRVQGTKMDKDSNRIVSLLVIKLK